MPIAIANIQYPKRPEICGMHICYVHLECTKLWLSECSINVCGITKKIDDHIVDTFDNCFVMRQIFIEINVFFIAYSNL